jgi:hypothetical protein
VTGTRTTIAIEAHEDSAQNGAALVMAVLFIAFLASAGIGLLFLSETSLKINRTSHNIKKSFYLAESGIEDGRRELFDINAGLDDFSERIEDAAGDDDAISFDAYALTAVYDNDGSFTGLTGYGDDVPLHDTSFLGQGFYAAFLTNDPQDGRTNLSDTNARAMVTGVGVGPNNSFKIVEAIVEPDLNLPPMPPAAVTLLGEEPYFFGGSSGAEQYRGNDCHFLGGGIPTLDVAVVGTTSEEAAEIVEDGMVGPPPKYRSGPYQGGETSVDLTDPDDPLVADAGLGTMDPIWNDCGFLQELVDTLRTHATYYCTTGGCILPDPTTIDDIIFVDGDVTAGPGYIGSGLLVVTGELTITGSSTFTGVVLAIGEGSVNRSGGGGGVISGTTLIADIAGPDEIFGNADDCSPVLDEDDDSSDPDTDPFGNSSYDVTGGGNSDIDFCTRFLAATEPRTYRVVEFRQL